MLNKYSLSLKTGLSLITKLALNIVQISSSKTKFAQEFCISKPVKTLDIILKIAKKLHILYIQLNSYSFKLLN